MEDIDTEGEKIITVKVKFQGELDQQSLPLKEGENIYTLLNYDKMRKKILQMYKYKTVDKDQIQLIIQNFYPRGKIEIPIHHPKNYTFLVNDMIGRGQTNICLKVHKLGELKKRKQREKAPIEFDSDGSVESVENEDVKKYITINKPTDKPYKSKDSAVRCFFCQRNSRQGEQTKRAGPFYGPLTNNNSYGHLLCLLWCSDVYLSQNTSKLCGVQKAIDKAKNLKCLYCQQKGASFYCHTKSCKKAGHYSCALNNSWYFNWSLYTTYCPECTSIYGHNQIVQNHLDQASSSQSEFIEELNSKCKIQMPLNEITNKKI